MTDESVKAYWETFLSTLPADSPYRSRTYIAEGWGDGPAMADELELDQVAIGELGQIIRSSRRAIGDFNADLG